MRRVYPLMWGLVCLLLVNLAACRNRTSETPSPTAPTETLPLPITIVGQLRAGREGVVTLGPIDVPNGTPAQVMTIGSYGVTQLTGQFRDGVAKLVLPTELTQRAGYLTLFGSTDRYAGETNVTIVAGEPAEPLTTLVGPRTLIANNRTWTTAVLVPFDRYNNPVPDGTPLMIEASRPDGSRETYRVTTDRLIAWQKLYSSTTAGRTRLAARAANAFGPETSFEETPAEPLPFSITADQTIFPADGHQLIELATTPLRDRYNNLLLDGTLITFVIHDSDNTQRTIPAYTLDGRAEITIQASALAGDMVVQATASQRLSDPLTLRFVTNEVRVPLAIQLDDGVLQVEAGPVLGTLQQFLPDGTDARFVIANDQFEGEAQTQPIENGRVSAEFRLENLPAGEYTLTVIVGDSSGQANFTISTRTTPQTDQSDDCARLANYHVCFQTLWLQFR